METETAEKKSESGVPEALTEAEFASLMRKGLADPVLAKALGRLGLVEVLLQATMMDVARRHGMAMEQKSRADEFEKQYDELKLHLNMYKDQWRRSIEKDGQQIHLAFRDWKTKHLNDEVTDVKEERDYVLAQNAHMRDCLKRIVEHCSWTRDEHDPLVTVGLLANQGLSVDGGDAWVKAERLAERVERAAVMALSNTDDQLRVSSAIRAAVEKELSK